MLAESRLASSFRDPSGFVFTRRNQIYRQVNPSYRPHYDLLMSSGLYRDLVDSGSLVAHEEVDPESAEPEAYKVLRPELVPFISYPYEWSFSQLKDAALATLDIQKKAMSHRMTLKDASAYNIQFHRGRPALIDVLSFEKYVEGEPWVGYKQFCQHFLAPLALMSYRHADLGQLARIHVDGVPLDVARALLPFRARLRPGIFVHLHMHAGLQGKYAGGNGPTAKRRTRSFTLTALRGLIDSLEAAVRKLSWKPQGTEWGDYDELGSYEQEALEHKTRLVADFLTDVQPRSVWDMGANTGHFSRLSSSMGIQTIAFDKDPAAVEKNYRSVVADKDACLLPLVLDLTNPSPGIGWANSERTDLPGRGPADMVLALALIHHLAISDNVPLNMIADFFSRLAGWMVIEFVPKSDRQVRRLLATREDIFPNYREDAFEEEFSAYFELKSKKRIPGSDRTMYLMKRR